MSTAVLEKPVVSVQGTDDDIAMLIGSMVTKFSDIVEKSTVIEIDGYVDEGEYFKIVNNEAQCAFSVPFEVVREHYQAGTMSHLIKALETCVFNTRLLGVTRIVGYYSRVQNWNASKIGELADRRIGNYWEDKRKNTEKVRYAGD